jgi:threonylcarbamoyladenosine tRNA methylthiotransferase MtaB
MKNAVPGDIRKKRNKMLRILSEKKLRQFYLNHSGETRLVLFEGDNKEGYQHGFTDNYIKVKTPYNKELINQLREVELLELDGDGCFSIKFLTPETVS